MMNSIYLKKDIPKTSERRTMKSLWLFTFLSIFMLQSNRVFANDGLLNEELGAVDCIAHVQISLDSTGFFVIKPVNLLSGHYPDLGVFKVNIMEKGRQDTLFCSDIGHPVSVMVLDTVSGNSCWSTVYVEDKLPPVITCVNDTLFCTVDPDSVDYSVYGHVTDNCDPNVKLTFSYTYTNYSCGSTQFSGYTDIIWLATDRYGFSDTCRSRVYFSKPSIFDAVFPPDTLMYCAIANPDSAGFPTIMGIGIPRLCDIAVSSKDDTTQICAGGYDIHRRWTIYDLCRTISYRTHTQLISVRDTVPPTFVCPDTITVGTDPFDCSVLYTFVEIAVMDACSPVDSITQQIRLDGIMHDPGDTITLDTGFYTLQYFVTDDCSNMDTCTSVLHVRDDDAPVLACTPSDTIGLGSDSIVIVSVDHFLMLSNAFDNCGIDTVLVRRMATNCGRPQDTVFTDSLGFCCADVGNDVMVVIKAIDQAGNSNFCMINVAVIDTFPPMITSSPNDTTISCTQNYLDTAVTGGIKYTDNCPSQLMVSVIDSNGVTSCKSGKIKRTFVVCDAGNNCDTAIQYITVINPYVFDTADVRWPADTTIDSCPADSLPSTIGSMVVVIGDSCQSIVVTFRDSVVSDTNDACLDILRTWEVWDTCSMVHTHLDSVQMITLLNYRPPFLSGPNDTVVVAKGCTDTVSLPPVHATDCSTNVSITNDFNSGGADASGEYPIGTTKVTFTAVDNCNKISTYMITVTVNDTVTPILICPPDTTLYCAIDFTLDSLVNYGTATFTDNCSDSVSIQVDTIVNLSKCNAGTVMRRWTTMDEAGNADTCMQTITIVIDTVDNNNVIWPKDTVISDCPPDSLPSTIGSMVQIVMNRCNTIKVTWSDNNISDPNDVCLTLKRTWHVTDSCSNTRPVQDSVQMITILNYKPPKLTVPPDVTVYASSGLCGANVTLDPATTTDCSSGVTITNDHNAGGANASGMYDIGTTCVVFTATDGCNKQSMDTTCVTVLDTIKPTLSCPPDTTVKCTEFDPNNLDKFGMFSAMDNCDSVVITIDTLDELDPCGVGMITRTWVVMDTFNNTDSCKQVITVLPDTLKPSDIICPPDSSDVDICDTVGIDSLLNLMPRVDSSKLGCAKLGFSYVDSTAMHCGEEFCKEITRKWTIIDSCTYDSMSTGIYFCTHKVRIRDTMPPTFDSIPRDTTIAAAPDSCSKFVRLKAHIWDCAGVKSISNDAPFQNSDSLDISGEYPLGVTLVTFVYEDSCCNLDSTIVSIRIIDTIPPTISCSPVTRDLSNSENVDHSIEVCASAFGLSYGDNCAPDSTLIVTLNKNNPADSCRTYNCDSLMGMPSKSFTIIIYVIDPSNNTIDSCSTTLTITDVMNVCGRNLPSPLSGVVHLMNHQGMKGIEVGLKDEPTPVAITDDSGRYEMVDISRPGSYEVIARYPRVTRMQGVNTRDLVVIQKHLLGLTDFEYPEQYIAADINNSNSVSTGDILALRKIVLGKTHPFESKPQWIVVSDHWGDELDPWDAKEIKVSFVDSQSVANIDMRALLLGDVDFSSLGGLYEIGETRAANITDLYVDQYADEDLKGLDYRIDNFEEVDGVQFELVFNPEEWSFDGLIPSGENLLCKENVSYQRRGDKGYVRISWSELNHGIKEGHFLLGFIPLVEGATLPKLMKEGYEGQIYYSDGSIRSLELKENQRDKAFEVSQNVPNPFDASTEIKVYLPEEDNVQLSIRDMTGRIVWEKTSLLSAGDQTIKVYRKDLPSNTAVFIYSVKTKWGIQSKKMVLLQ